MRRDFSIGRREVGSGKACFIIAEVGQAHDGSLGMAHSYIDVAARAGADAVKFQTHIAAAESTRHERFRTEFSRQDETRYDYWKRMEFSESQWRGLSEHAKERGLEFLSSPFSEQAVELLRSIDVPAWKIGAGEVANTPLLESIAEFGQPVLLSTGMSGWKEIDAAVDLLRSRDVPLAVLQCTSEYPCPPEKVGLNILAEIRRRYDCSVGLSDHSGTIYAGLAAVALGADVLELHVTHSRDSFGPDVTSSVTIQELASLVEGVRFVEKAMQHPVDKDAAAAELEDLRRMFGKSIVAARDLSAGSVLSREDIAFKKPGTGVPAAMWQELSGRVLQRDVCRDELLNHCDFEQ